MVATLWSAVAASARTTGDSTVIQRFHIYYPINDTELHEDYHENWIRLGIIREYFKKSPRIDSIVIYSYSSPEGRYSYNKYLAEERGKRAREYLLKHLPADRDFPDSLIIVNSTAENWDGLYELIEKQYPYSNKQRVLDLISRTDISNDRKKELLKGLGNQSWSYIKQEILPKLRYATWVAEWVYVPIVVHRKESGDDIPQVATIQTQAETDTTIAPTIEVPPFVVPVPVREECDSIVKKTILALKTNLLYDAATLLNYSVEFPLYRNRLSFLLYHQFPWWTWGKGDNEYCIRFLSVGGEARCWFGSKDRFNGHFLGIYGESGKYDFEFQREICYQGEFYTAGLSYGYALPVAKNLNMEFSISAGYASIAYRGYTPSEDYEILWREPSKVGRLKYWGPTKLQISLVVPIRAKFKKGGER